MPTVDAVTGSQAEQERVVNDFLDREWDPIGVYDGPEGPPPGEYSSYAPTVLSDLQNGADADQIFRHLRQFRSRMGLAAASDRRRDRDVAQALVDWWARRER